MKLVDDVADPARPPAAADARTGARLRIASRIVAAGVGCFALAILACYVADRPLFPSQTGATISLSTATAIVLLASLILLRSFDRKGHVVAACAGTIACVVLLSLFVFGEDRVTPFLATRLFGRTPLALGLTAASTACCILLLALASSRGIEGRMRLPKGLRLANVLLAIALVISGLGVLGHAYGASALFAVPPFHAMSTPTAICLFGLSLATLGAQPAYGWAATISSRLVGGSATRRQLIFTLLPPVVGWLLVATLDNRWIEPNTALALLVALTIVPLAALVLRDGAVLDLLDVERAEAAAAQRRMNHELNARLQVQATQLEAQARARLAAEEMLNRTQRLEAVGQLTGGIAHDFNNLLMAVNGNLELMRRHLPEDHSVQRYLRHATAATGKGTKVTQQLLAFSRTQRLELQAVDVTASLQAALDLIHRALGPETSVELDAASDANWARADADQLELAVLNLAINSRDAMQTTGVIRIRQRREDGEMHGFVVVSVADDGCGMPPDVLAKATEPFYTTKPTGRGTGLGLAQAYGFARQCGGDLKITSEVGVGTTVEIWLPGADAPLAPAPVANSAEPVVGPRAATVGRRILVIDDDDDVRTAVAEALRQSGHAVVEADNGSDGLARLSERQTDLAVIDFIMPGMNGAVVARQAQRQQPGLPIVFVSGYSDTASLDGIANAVLIRKPFALETLCARIEELTSGR